MGLLSHSYEWQIGPLNLDMTIGFIDAEKILQDNIVNCDEIL